jgi:hypothetical protein
MLLGFLFAQKKSRPKARSLAPLNQQPEAQRI